MRHRSKAVQRLLVLLELVLWLYPVFTMEAQHARHCQSTISLWNNAVTIEDPAMWSNIWLGGALLHFTCKATLHFDNTGKRSFGRLPNALKRQFYMLCFMGIMRLLVAANVANVCVYSLPLCSMLLVTCEKMINLAASSTHV